MEGEVSRKSFIIQDRMFIGQEKEDIFKYLRKNIIGDLCYFQTPFGFRPLVYADYVASGRSLDFIEKYLIDCVLPFYANTHTFTSHVGTQIGSLREEAREIIKEALNCTEEDAVIFAGSGSTGAINKMVKILKESNWGSIQGFYGQAKNGRFPCLACGEFFQSDGPFKKHLIKKHKQNYESTVSERPVVFVTNYEHHSNILPWRENGADVVFINDNESGELDLEHLVSELVKYSDRRFKIGSFSACSNVTGIVTDVVKVTDIMKEHGALVFFDYAGGGPYLVMDMNPKGHNAIDGIFISGHKFLGGPGSPGILCVKRRLLGNKVPIQAGGGTVFYVSASRHIFLENPEEKEEGGTPDIIGAIRLGLVFHLKSSVGDKIIMNTEFKHFKRILKILEEIPNFQILGSTSAKRIPIISFNIQHKDKIFHYGFISALLNDLFGIETRGGCACASPYTQHLMKISNKEAEKFNDLRLDGCELYVFGFCRLSINYFFSNTVIEYIIESLKFVSKYAIWFLPLYRFELHQKAPTFIDNKNLENEIFSLKKLHLEHEKMKGQLKKKAKPEDLKNFTKIANKILKNLMARHISNEELVKESIYNEEAESLRWFVIPSEASRWIYNKRIKILETVLFAEQKSSKMQIKKTLPLPHIRSAYYSSNNSSIKINSRNSEYLMKDLKDLLFQLNTEKNKNKSVRTLREQETLRLGREKQNEKFKNFKFNKKVTLKIKANESLTLEQICEEIDNKDEKGYSKLKSVGSVKVNKNFKFSIIKNK